MKNIILALFALTTLSACTAACYPDVVDGDDVYRRRTRDYNWYDGRTEYHGDTGKYDQLYHNGAQDGSWTEAK